MFRGGDCIDPYRHSTRVFAIQPAWRQKRASDRANCLVGFFWRRRVRQKNRFHFVKRARLCLPTSSSSTAQFPF
jgi:hypothetical protein